MDKDIQWWSSSTEEIKYRYSYISSTPKTYGIHPVKVSYGETSIEVDAKFDTGAKSCSIGLDLARRLNIPQEILLAAEMLEEEKIHRDISEDEIQKKVFEMAKGYSCLEIGTATIGKTKSASGMTLRVFVPIKVEYDGKIVETRANIKDRKGLKAEMLIGLSVMS